MTARKQAQQQQNKNENMVRRKTYFCLQRTNSDRFYSTNTVVTREMAVLMRDRLYKATKARNRDITARRTLDISLRQTQNNLLFTVSSRYQGVLGWCSGRGGLKKPKARKEIFKRTAKSLLSLIHRKTVRIFRHNLKKKKLLAGMSPLTKKKIRPGKNADIASNKKEINHEYKNRLIKILQKVEHWQNPAFSFFIHLRPPLKGSAAAAARRTDRNKVAEIVAQRRKNRKAEKRFSSIEKALYHIFIRSVGVNIPETEVNARQKEQKLYDLKEAIRLRRQKKTIFLLSKGSVYAPVRSQIHQRHSPTQQRKGSILLPGKDNLQTSFRKKTTFSNNGGRNRKYRFQRMTFSDYLSLCLVERLRTPQKTRLQRRRERVEQVNRLTKTSQSTKARNNGSFLTGNRAMKPSRARYPYSKGRYPNYARLRSMMDRAYMIPLLRTTLYYNSVSPARDLLLFLKTNGLHIHRLVSSLPQVFNGCRPKKLARK